MKNTLMLDAELAGNLSDYAEGDEVQCMVTATVGPTTDKGMTLSVTGIEPEEPAEDAAEPEEEPAPVGKRAPALEKAMKA